jgi:hypothetical protein
MRKVDVYSMSNNFLFICLVLHRRRTEVLPLLITGVERSGTHYTWAMLRYNGSTYGTHTYYNTHTKHTRSTHEAHTYAVRTKYIHTQGTHYTWAMLRCAGLPLWQTHIYTILKKIISCL